MAVMPIWPGRAGRATALGRAVSSIATMTATPVAHEEIRRRYFAAIASAVGIDLRVFEDPGTTVAASDERRGRGTAVVNQIGPHSLVWCDPAVVSRVQALASDSVAFPPDAVEAWAPSVGATFVGGARSLLADTAMLEVVDPPDESTPVGLDPDEASARSLIAALLDASDPADVDAAEMDLEALDRHVVGLLDEAGSLGAIASERPWEYDGQFGDIGVLVHPDRRRGGWGRAAVSILAHQVLAEGRFPLYRCNWDREPSHRLALSLGFRQATELAAAHFETRDRPGA